MSIQFQRGVGRRIRASALPARPGMLSRSISRSTPSGGCARSGQHPQLTTYVEARFTPEFKVAFDAWQRTART